ncbi:MAG: hypothetical protein N2202_07265 [Proteobacteria bacterium]|nr:hypothetical protein [Pseudomonadota bacterium]
MTKNIYEDINLSKITFPEEKDIKVILEDDIQTHNIVINYIKTIIYTSGQVSKEQENIFRQSIANLSESKREKIIEILQKQLSRCNCKFIIIDLSGGDHYLPLKIIGTN